MFLPFVCLVLLWPCLDIYCTSMCRTLHIPSAGLRDVVRIIKPSSSLNEAHYLAQLALSSNKTNTQTRLEIRVLSQSGAALGMTMSSSPLLWSRQKYLKSNWLYYHEIIHIQLPLRMSGRNSVRHQCVQTFDLCLNNCIINDINDVNTQQITFYGLA